MAVLKESSQELGISEWVDQTEEKFPKLLPSVGSVCIPRTTNAIERFFSFFFLAVGDPTFNQFYKKRYGFFSVVSAKRELILFLVMYLFIRQPESGKAPIESIMPDAREMPLYELINDPLRTVMGVENVNRNVKPVLAKAGNGKFWASALYVSSHIASWATQRSPHCFDREDGLFLDFCMPRQYNSTVY